MTVYSVFDKEFRPFGRVLEGFDTAALDLALAAMPMPEEGVSYVASEPALESLPLFYELKTHIYGDMPIQMGSCCGKNDRLNCLEYHRDSELNYFAEDVVLMLGALTDMNGYKFDSSSVRLFAAPKGTLVELYATTLHYCPANIDPRGFRAACVLPRGTNTPIGSFERRLPEDGLLYMKNKWIIAHPEAPEASTGVTVGITGDNTVLSLKAL